MVPERASTGFVPILLQAGGLLFVVVGVLMVVRLPRRRDWRRTTGRVVGTEHRDRGTGDSDASYPIVEYLLPDGTAHRFTANTTRNLSDLRREVSLLVDPEDPRRAELASANTTRVLIGVVFTLLGLGAAFMGHIVSAMG